MGRLATSFVLGYHGCEKSTADDVISGQHDLAHSTKAHDWLGSGSYFWESDFKRALEWAQSRRYQQPAVVGAVIDLGNCLDLLNRTDLELLRSMYPLFKLHTEDLGEPLPKNENHKSDDNGDLILRKLDCAVVNFTHNAIRDAQTLEDPPEPFDTVRGLFLEGAPLYDGSGFRDKTHVQIVVCNNASIKGYFHPRKGGD